MPSVVAVWMSAALLHDIPWGDHLTLVKDGGILEGLSLRSLFRFHNEHLIVPTKLAVAADYRLWRGANILPAACSLLFMLALVGLEARMFRRAVPGLSAGGMLLVTAALAAVLINGRLTWTFTFPILLQHVSANLCVAGCIAAFAILAAGTTDHRGRNWIACLTAAGLAAISSAAGVFALPSVTAATILLVAASPSLRRRPWRGPVLAALVIGAGIIAAYAGAYGLVAPASRPRPDLLQAIRFALYFPGGAWFRDGTWPVLHRADPLLLHAVVLGFWLLVAQVAVRLWRRYDGIGDFEIFHVGMLLFVVITAAVGGLFRGGLGDFEALNRKYPPTSLLAWASLVSLMLRDRTAWLCADGPRATARRLGLATVAVAAILPGDLVEYRAWSAWRDELTEAIHGYAAGVRTEAVLLHFFPDADRAEQLVAAVDAADAYWFRHGGDAAAAISPSAGAPAGGRVDRIPDHTDYALEFINDVKEPLGKQAVRTPRSAALRLAGWAVDRQAGVAADGVELVVDGTRYRCRTGLVRGDVAEFFSQAGFARSGFECFLPPGTLVPGEHRAKLWIILADGERYLETPSYRIIVE